MQTGGWGEELVSVSGTRGISHSWQLRWEGRHSKGTDTSDALYLHSCTRETDADLCIFLFHCLDSFGTLSFEGWGGEVG